MAIPDRDSTVHAPANHGARYPVQKLRGLIVSCQARADNPLHGPVHMVAMAQATVQAGASAIRANGTQDIAGICASVDLPVIGLNKLFDSTTPVYITPSFATADAVAGAGARIIAIDATSRERPAEPLNELIDYIHNQLNCAVFADVSTLQEGARALELGADYIATTLSGYTAQTEGLHSGPDLGLVRELVKISGQPVIAEGRYRLPPQVKAALDLGAAAVVVGTAITNPRDITRRFIHAISKTQQ